MPSAWDVVKEIAEKWRGPVPTTSYGGITMSVPAAVVAERAEANVAEDIEEVKENGENDLLRVYLTGAHGEADKRAWRDYVQAVGRAARSEAPPPSLRQATLFASHTTAPQSASSGFESVQAGLPRATAAFEKSEREYTPQKIAPSRGSVRSAAGVAKKIHEKKAKLPTFAKQRTNILAELRKAGWNVTDGLKVPHATSPDGRARYWFKTQAIYAEGRSDKSSFNLGDAHSFMSDMREKLPTEVAAYLIRAAPSVAENER
jgi:hypothetical protein